MTPQGLLVGLAAGLSSAFLFAGLVTQSATALGLSLAAPIPILIASLGWGSASGFVAAFASGAVIALVAGTSAVGFTLLAVMALPAAIIGHLCGLARPREERTGRAMTPANDGGAAPLDWYPLDRILFAIVILSAIGCILIGWLVGFDADTMLPMLREALSAPEAPDLDATDAQLEDIARLVVTIVPFVQPALLVANFVATLYLAAAVTRMSGRLQRPRDDVPAQAGLPRIAPVLFAVSLAVSFLGGPVGLVGAVFAGAFGAAFTLVGLAAFHRLGGLGDTVRVRDGYARNFLLPTGRALRSNEANRARFESQKADLVARNEERKKDAGSIGETLGGKRFVVVRSAGETGQLYGSVSARDISDLLKAEGFAVGRNQVDLNQPIKAIGLHKVSIVLHAEVQVEIELNIARSQDEAERQAQGETLTSADAIYGYDEDAIRAEDLGGAMYDEDEEGDDRPARTSDEGTEGADEGR